MDCYKVTDSIGASIVMRENGRVRYSTRTYAKAPEALAEMGMHLFTFDTLMNAIRFTDTTAASGTIWLADGKEPCEIPEKVPNFISAATHAYISISYPFAPRMIMIDYHKGDYPIGTLMFKEVKLKKIVWEQYGGRRDRPYQRVP